MPDPTLANLQKEIIDLKIRVNNLEKAESFFEKISVVNDALTAFKTGGVSAMHDPTEGGVAGGCMN